MYYGDVSLYVKQDLSSCTEKNPEMSHTLPRIEFKGQQSSNLHIPTRKGLHSYIFFCFEFVSFNFDVLLPLFCIKLYNYLHKTLIITYKENSSRIKNMIFSSHDLLHCHVTKSAVPT